MSAFIPPSDGEGELRILQDGDKVKFTVDGEDEVTIPFLWLRDNCRCQDCYDFVALARKYVPLDLQADLTLEKIWCNGVSVCITWSDGHCSTFERAWLIERAISSKGRQEYNDLVDIPKEPWPAANFIPDTFEYNSVMKNEAEIYNFLLTLERNGIAVIKNTPKLREAGQKLLENVAFPKQTQFGMTCSVKIEDNHSYPASTEKSLGLHSDLSYYRNCPGILLIHFMEQPLENGGESLLVDGLFSANYLKRNHPEAFRIITTTNTYFYDKANPKFDQTKNKFKINKAPIIRLDIDGKFSQITFDNAKRDAYVDLPPHAVADYYKALKVFHDTIYKYAHVIKMEAGDIVVLDNYRCLHGRKAYNAYSPRHLELSYLDWDEAKCRRRNLQNKFS